MLAWAGDHFIEIFGAIAGIVYVFLEIKQNIWLWPLGIVTSAIYIYVFHDSKFYADMGLQWYYLLISFYGWYWWRRGGREESEISSKEEREGVKEGKGAKLPISRMTFGSGVILLFVSVVLFVIIRFILIRYTDSTLPGWDAFTTAISIVATWMLARKILEHWLIWIIADIVSIGLYIYKGLFPTVILFAVYSIMAIVGYLEWNKAMKMDELNITEL